MHDSIESKADRISLLCNDFGSTNFSEIESVINDIYRLSSDIIELAVSAKEAGQKMEDELIRKNDRIYELEELTQ